MTPTPEELDALEARARNGLCTYEVFGGGYFTDAVATIALISSLAAAIRALRQQLADARNDALHDAVRICVRFRRDHDTTEEQAVGAMECALAIQDAISNPPINPLISGAKP